MFDPTIGRWLTEDPDGLEAGDENLYRYVHNDPTNLTDPSGLKEGSVASGVAQIAQWKPGEIHGFTGDLKANGLSHDFNAIILNVPTRSALLKLTTRVDPATAPKPPAGWKIHGVGGGDYFVWDEQDKILIGPRGSGPCAGLILIPPKPEPGKKRKPFYAFHFRAIDSPRDSIVSLGGSVPPWFNEKFKGYSAVICGAQPNAVEEQDKSMRWGLNDVIVALRDNGIKNVRYVPGPNALVDKDGNIYWAVLPGTDLRGY